MLRRCRHRGSGSTVGRAVLQGPYRHDPGRYSRRAASTTFRLGWWRAISAVSFRAIRTSSCRTCRARGGLVTANRLYQHRRERRLGDRQARARACRSSPSRAIRNASSIREIHLARQPVVLCRRRLSDARSTPAHPAKTIADLKTPGMSVTLGADNAASSNLIFAADRQGGARPQRQGRARLSPAPRRCSSPCSAASSTARWSGLSSVRAGQRDLWDRRRSGRSWQFGRTTRHAEFPRHADRTRARRTIPTPWR